eukprot:CAMPEP_0198328296 /NCGR_PEP_ID=MMETSP1450-20131203/15372_1 /TAXON_ID=753684 ORGANISM="Madagascaria erythrocladiodes, Strain CCMP3234" /NCGR_SAMPLE_ID=MMETSP1450 /ASSEMBLY_ACC=CAM_ASM_001115 /LENGTH=183 /DNA_ID=CAMNT_0044032423 /DNA_START=127 /DNA_END=674 /DNA_ORIENTATION=-
MVARAAPLALVVCVLGLLCSAAGGASACCVGNFCYPHVSEVLLSEASQSTVCFRVARGCEAGTPAITVAVGWPMPSTDPRLAADSDRCVVPAPEITTGNAKMWEVHGQNLTRWQSTGGLPTLECDQGQGCYGSLVLDLSSFLYTRQQVCDMYNSLNAQNEALRCAAPRVATPRGAAALASAVA